jgi:hypothetical protein
MGAFALLHRAGALTSRVTAIIAGDTTPEAMQTAKDAVRLSRIPPGLALSRRHLRAAASR